MKVRWSETARTEVEDIFSYIYESNRSAAAVVDRVDGLVALLREFPSLGLVTQFSLTLQITPLPRSIIASAVKGDYDTIAFK